MFLWFYGIFIVCFYISIIYPVLSLFYPKSYWLLNHSVFRWCYTHVMIAVLCFLLLFILCLFWLNNICTCDPVQKGTGEETPCAPQALSSHLTAWIPLIKGSRASPSWTPSFRVWSSGWLVAGLCAALLQLLGRAEDALSVTASWGSIWKQSTHHLNCSKGLLLASFSSVPYCVNGESGFLSLRCILQVHFWCFSFGAARIQRVHRERRMTGSTAVFPSWNPLTPLKGR